MITFNLVAICIGYLFFFLAGLMFQEYCFGCHARNQGEREKMIFEEDTKKILEFFDNVELQKIFKDNFIHKQKVKDEIMQYLKCACPCCMANRNELLRKLRLLK